MNNILNLYDLTGAGSSLMSGYEIAKNLTHPGKFLNMLANANPGLSAGASGAASGYLGGFSGISPGSAYGYLSGLTGTSPGYTGGLTGTSPGYTGIQGTQAADKSPISRETMTIGEYKQYLYGRISQIPRHPSRALESVSIHITEAGFEAMKKDPDYEAWVLDDLRTGWAQPDPWAPLCGGAYSVIRYGAAKEDCSACSWFPGYQNGNGERLFQEKSKDSFWERRAESQKLYQEQSRMTALEWYYRQQNFSLLSGFFGK